MKKTILYVHHSGNQGGAPISLSYIINGIDRSTYDPVLVTIANGPINKLFEKMNVRFFLLKGAKPFHGATVVEKHWRLFVKNWIYLLPSIIQAFKFLKKVKPDLIHLNSTCLFSFAIAAHLYNKNIPVLCHVREPVRKGIWGWPLRKFCKAYVDGFIAISQNDLHSLALPEDHKHHAEVIYNFYAKPERESRVPNSFRSEFNIPPGDIIFLYLARFAPSNGWRELIKNAKALDLKENAYRIVLVGATEDYPEYEHIPNVHIVNFREDIPAILEASDIFVCPFTEPHFARGVIEASAYGLPVIGANIGGVNELILHEHTGYLYDSKEAFLKYAKLLAGNTSLRETLGQQGVAFADQQFNMQKNLEKTYQFYKYYL